jgi:hypothetical protein
VAHTSTRISSGKLALILAASAVLAGCGSHSPDGTPTAPANRTAAKKPPNPGDQLSRNMVSAVASNKPSTVPVQVKFELHDRPDIGQPVDLDLAIVPMSASVDRLAGRVDAEDGLELVEGADIPASDRPTEGVPIRHTVKVLPKREGVFTVRAALTVDSAGVSSTESYSIPVIAGLTAPQSDAKPASPAAAPAQPPPLPDKPPAGGTHTAAAQ